MATAQEHKFTSLVGDMCAVCFNAADHPLHGGLESQIPPAPITINPPSRHTHTCEGCGHIVVRARNLNGEEILTAMLDNQPLPGESIVANAEPTTIYCTDELCQLPPTILCDACRLMPNLLFDKVIEHASESAASDAAASERHLQLNLSQAAAEIYRPEHLDELGKSKVLTAREEVEIRVEHDAFLKLECDKLKTHTEKIAFLTAHIEDIKRKIVNYRIKDSSAHILRAKLETEEISSLTDEEREAFKKAAQKGHSASRRDKTASKTADKAAIKAEKEKQEVREIKSGRGVGFDKLVRDLMKLSGKDRDAAIEWLNREK